MKLRIYILIIVMVISVLVGAQEKRKIFLGIQPGITKEKFYEKNEFDANILPFVLEMSVTKRINIRFNSVLNYHFGGKSKISDIGIQTVAPFFLTKREKKSVFSRGFYIGPMLGLGQNLVNEHFTTTLAIEPGYLFRTEKSFSFSIGIQYGGSNFNYKQRNSEWVEHFGVKVNLGFWI